MKTSPVEDSEAVGIVDMCLAIDIVAADAYAELASFCDNDELKAFWQQMSREEKTHIDFWRRLKEADDKCSLPPVFDDAEETKAELRRILPRARALLERSREVRDVASALVLAYRLECFMLHPAFEVLFHLLRTASEGPDPEEEYEAHINRFVHMFSKHAELSPELELLGESLQRLWKDNKRLAYQASRDVLTGLFNRRGFFSMSTQLCYLAMRRRWNVGIMVLDIDAFKAINDGYGHTRGDRVLSDVARILKSGLRSSDIVARYGGDEFIVLFPETKADSVLVTAEKIKKLIEVSEPDDLYVTVSIGVSCGNIVSDPKSGLEALIHSADSNLYTAKEKGKNQVYAGRGSQDEMC